MIYPGDGLRRIQEAYIRKQEVFDLHQRSSQLGSQDSNDEED